MKRFQILTWLVFLFPALVVAQAKLTFVDMNGFPDVIVQGQSYALEGYIANYGNSSTPAVLDIKMSVNGSAPITLSNNYSFGSGILPGDTAYWHIPSHTFGSGNLLPGNNDILIWPTGPSGSNMEQDSTPKVVYFAQTAAFRTNRSMIDFGDESMNLFTPYSLHIRSVNEGAGANLGEIRVMCSFEPGHAFELTRMGENFFPGDTIDYWYPLPFKLQEMVEKYSSRRTLSNPENVRFWMEEVNEIPPIQVGVVDVNSISTGVEPAQTQTISLMGNVVSESLSLKGPQTLTDAVESMQIFDLQGKTHYANSQFASRISVENLPAGTYFLHIQSDNDTQTMKFVKL